MSLTSRKRNRTFPKTTRKKHLASCSAPKSHKAGFNKPNLRKLTRRISCFRDTICLNYIHNTCTIILYIRVCMLWVWIPHQMESLYHSRLKTNGPLGFPASFHGNGDLKLNWRGRWLSSFTNVAYPEAGVGLVCTSFYFRRQEKWI